MSDKQSTSGWHSAARTLALVTALAAFAACTTVTQPTRPSVDARQLELRARTAVDAGNLAVAADLYAQLAATTSGTARIEYLLASARYAAQSGDNALARRRLNEARVGATREQVQRSTVLSAELELAEDRPQSALDLLGGLAEPLADTPRQEAAAVRGRALFRLGRPVEAVRVLAERELWLNDAAAVLANQHLIWDGFKQYPPTSVPAPTGDATVDGWLALAPLATVAASDLRREFLTWRQTFTNHPAAGGLLAELLAAQRSAAFPAQIALLLPLGSPQRAAALAIRDGFMAAHLERADHATTSIRVYDTTLLGSEQAYLRAQLDGADFIVGPLLRSDVDAVVAQAGFVPTLALNLASDAATFARDFYQFALAPGDEARTIAAAAASQGAKTALVLVPSDARGYQIRDEFVETFAAYGGEVLNWNGYEPALRDFSQPVSALLNVTRSVQRHRRLAANLGEPLEFPEARRRQDVDMIFLVADAQIGRLIAPLLRFYAAGDIPTYATAQIFDPANTARENDLNGLIFADTPSLIDPNEQAASLRRELEAFWPQRTSQIRLYGMGVDAYRLIATLYTDERFGWPVHGMSGELSIDATGRVRRALPLAQFRNGRPAVLEQSIEPPLAPDAGPDSLVGRR
jgi:uncharacterized protein